MIGMAALLSVVSYLLTLFQIVIPLLGLVVNIHYSQGSGAMRINHQYPSDTQDFHLSYRKV